MRPTVLKRVSVRPRVTPRDEGDEGADAGSEPSQPEDSTGEGSGEEAGEDESISTNSTESGEETTSGESVPGGNGVSQGGDTGPKSIEDLLQDAFDDLSGAGDSALENDDVREEYDRLTEAAEHSNSGPEADIWGNPEENLDYYRRRYGNGDDLISARQTADRCEDVLRRLRPMPLPTGSGRGRSAHQPAEVPVAAVGSELLGCPRRGPRG